MEVQYNIDGLTIDIDGERVDGMPLYGIAWLVPAYDDAAYEYEFVVDEIDLDGLVLKASQHHETTPSGNFHKTLFNAIRKVIEADEAAGDAFARAVDEAKAEAA